MDYRPYPPVNSIDRNNWQPYTKLIPANEVHEWINLQVFSEEGNIHMQIYPIVDATVTPLTFLSALPSTESVATGAALDLAVVMQGGSAPYIYVWKKCFTVIPG